MKVIKKDLQIFRGTYKEVQEAETLDYCIYLAWDTHELFVGNAAGKKTKYCGGKQLTEREVVELVRKLTTTMNQGLREQLLETSKTNTDLSSQITSLTDLLNKTVDELKNDTKEYIYKMIADVFDDDLSDFTYTRYQIDDKINKLHDTYYDKNDIDIKFNQHENVMKTSLRDGFIQYKEGSEIIELLDRNNEESDNGLAGHTYDGVYLSLSDFNTLKKGYTYMINGINLVLVSSGGGGSGGSYIKPVIKSLLIDNKSYIQIEAGTSYDQTVRLINEVENEENIATTLTLQQDGVDIVQNILPNDSTVFTPSLTNLKISKHNFTLYGKDTRDNIISKTIYLYADIPVKYGYGLDILDKESLNQLEYSELKRTLSGEYSLDIPSGNYFWICVPGYTYQSEKGSLALNTEKVKSHGFSYPLEGSIEVSTTINGINVVYNCYRSSSPDAGEVKLKLTIE